MSPVKEPHYFSGVEQRPENSHFTMPVSSPEEYGALFAGSEGFRAVGEASPSYLWEETAPGRIRRSVPEAKIIVLLRDPIERAYSHYLMDVRAGRQREPFYEALMRDAEREEKAWGVSHLYVELGHYAAQVSRYLDTFGGDRVLVAMFEDLKRDAGGLLRLVCSFLEVDQEAVDSVPPSGRHNAYAAPRGELAKSVLGSRRVRRLAQQVVPKQVRHYARDRLLLSRGAKPELDWRSIEYLASEYEGEIDRLEQILGKKLPDLREE